MTALANALLKAGLVSPEKVAQLENSERQRDKQKMKNELNKLEQAFEKRKNKDVKNDLLLI
jgi:hypothetical protein